MLENILKGLIKIQNIIRLSFSKLEKRNYEHSTHQEVKSLFSKVHQQVNQNYIVTDYQSPQVIIKLDGFTHNTGRFDLIFENTGQSTAIIQKLTIGRNDTNIDEFSLSPQQKVKKEINVSGFKILEEKLSSPNFELVYKDFSNNKKYKTVGSINQESRADGKYNLGKLTDQQLLPLQLPNQLEKREIEILQAMRVVMKRDGEGNAYLLSTNQSPDFVKVGDKTFIKEGEPLIAREYMECLRSLFQKGLVEQKSEKRFVLTTEGMK
jgi:hypothetical protein